MPNWCSNVVSFHANETTVREIAQLFQEMVQKQKETNCGQLPPFSTRYGDWFFDIQWEDEAMVYYHTRWAPNLTVLVQIANRFRCGFECEYEEMGNLVYGKAVYADGILTDTYLEPRDFDRFEEKEDTYIFRGEVFHSQYEILDTLLESKQQQLKKL